MLKADGFDDCILGVSEGAALGNLEEPELLVYSSSKIIEKLAKDMTQEEAEEYFDFNILGAYMGAGTPIFVRDYIEEDL